MDIFIAVLVYTIQSAVAALGVYVTVYPLTQHQVKHKRLVIGLIVGLWIAGLVVTALDRHRSTLAQRDLHSQLDRIKLNTDQPPHVQVTNTLPPTQVIIKSDGLQEAQARKLDLKKRLIALSREIITFDEDYEKRGPKRLDDPRLGEYAGAGAAKAYNDRFKGRVRRICKEAIDAGLNVQGLDRFEAVNSLAFQQVSQALAALAEKL